MTGVEVLEEMIRVKRSLPSPDARRAIRESVGVSQGDVAVALGVSQRSVSRWETGESDPTKQVLADYVDLLDRMSAA